MWSPKIDLTLSYKCFLIIEKYCFFNIHCDIYLCYYKYFLQCSLFSGCFLVLMYLEKKAKRTVEDIVNGMRLRASIQIFFFLSSKLFFLCKCQVSTVCYYADACKTLENAIHTLTSSISSSMPMLYRSWRSHVGK